MSDCDSEPQYDPEGRWLIDCEEYRGLVRVMIRARAAVRAARPNGDGSVRVPPRAAGELRECLQEFGMIDQARRLPCRLRMG